MYNLSSVNKKESLFKFLLCSRLSASSKSKSLKLLAGSIKKSSKERNNKLRFKKIQNIK